MASFFWPPSQGAGGGVTSLNALTGDVILSAGTGISLSTLGNDITINSTTAFGNLTDVGTDGIVITGGTGAVVGTGTSIAQHVADTTHNGYLSSTDWTTFNGKQAAGNYITALTGDGTAAGPGSVAFTLATVNSNVGSFGSSTAIPSFTVNGKGLVTAASTNSVIAPAGTLTGTTLASNVVTSSLTSVGTLSSLTVTGNILNSALTASQAVFTDASKNLISNAITGTGNVVMSASPTLTGTITAAAANFSSNIGVAGTLIASALLGVDGASNQNVLSGGTQRGITSWIGGTSAATSSLVGFDAQPTTQAAAFTCASVTSYFSDPAKGAGSTITRLTHFRGNGTPSVGTNNAFLADNNAYTGTWFINQSGTAASTLGGNMTMRHLLGGGSSTPSIAAGAGAGTGNAVSIIGTDLAGVINITIGSTPSGTNAVIATVTFATAFSAAPYVVFSAANSQAANIGVATGVFMVAPNASTFTITSGVTALTLGNAYAWNYHVIG